jgi:hypothetical protein
MKWIPNTEGEPEPYVPSKGVCDKRRVFYIDENVVNRTLLPVLSFRMREGSPLLYIPLEGLLYKRPSEAHTHPERSYFAIQSFESIIGDEICMADQKHPRSPTSLLAERISLGSMALRSLYAGFDYETRRVGFANKARVLDVLAERSSVGSGGNELCSAQASCIGGQELELSTNACADPNCAKYFFQEVDATTKLCKLNSGIQYLMYSLFGLCALVEVTMQLMYEHAVHAVRTQPTSSMGPPRHRYMWERARGAVSGWMESPPATW